MPYGKQCLQCKKLEAISVGAIEKRICNDDVLEGMEFTQANGLQALLFRAANAEQCPLYEEK